MTSQPSQSHVTFTVTDRQSQTEADRAAWWARTPEERLDAVETLRLQSGKFLYECATSATSKNSGERAPAVGGAMDVPPPWSASATTMWLPAPLGCRAEAHSEPVLTYRFS